MPKKLRENIKKVRIKNVRNSKKRIKISYLWLSMVLGLALVPRSQVQAEGCPDLSVIFARGSGGERWTNDDYLEFKATIQSKLATTKLSYTFTDLDYPAVGVGIENLGTTVGAFFGAGEAYEFGESVNTGVKNLKKLVNGSACPNTKYVLGGYSQGAMAISKALADLNANKVIYAATFGDPKIYLPEGKGLIPAACRNENLSEYRMYVPDCQAYKGLLGAYIPYQPEAFTEKLGTWCNKRDFFCSSHLNMDDHLSYVSDAIYEDASRVIFDKITKEFGLENHISSPHDTAFLIDSTGSMAGMIEQYKSEALRLATETINSGGRVALYDYRDLSDPYIPVEHCNFETCTLEVFKNELAKIRADGGGDTPESLLSASFHAMQSLKWKYGSTKSMVVLTDANFLAPDRDGMTLDEVVRLSKTIDPVNFYIITNPDYDDYYSDLAMQTGGKVVTNLDELNLLTDYIIERYDSLPRVEESLDATIRPTIKIKEVDRIDDEVKVSFETDGAQTLIILNDMILGTTQENEITISGVRSLMKNELKLVPLDNDARGEEVVVNLNGYGSHGTTSSTSTASTFSIPKAPNTGKK